MLTADTGILVVVTKNAVAETAGVRKGEHMPILKIVRCTIQYGMRVSVGVLKRNLPPPCTHHTHTHTHTHVYAHVHRNQQLLRKESEPEVGGRSTFHSISWAFLESF